MYEVIDIQTKQVIATRATRVAARKLADRKDFQYGAIRYVVRLNQKAVK